MRTKLVRRYVVPHYPTRDYLLEHPELLRWIPKRWQHNPLVLGALGMVVPLILARPAVAAGEGVKDAPAVAVRVAPLFPHGEGRGSFGCVAMNPPVFLSEDEARQVIRDEAKKAGIEFVEDGLTIKDAEVPVTNPYDFLDEREENNKAKAAQKNPPKKPKLQKQDLVLDGYDKKRRIAFEFVSGKDFNKWEKRGSGWCSASVYDLKATAEHLKQGLAQSKSDAVVGVFYEPGMSPPKIAYPKKGADADWKAYYKAREKAGKELGEKELRKQVRDFLDWLKTQGVI